MTTKKTTKKPTTSVFETEDKFIHVCGMIGLIVTPCIKPILDDVFGQCTTNEVCFHTYIGEVCSSLLGFLIGPIIGAFIGVFLYETLYIIIPSLLSSIKTRLCK